MAANPQTKPVDLGCESDDGDDDDVCGVQVGQRSVVIVRRRCRDGGRWTVGPDGEGSVSSGCSSASRVIPLQVRQ